MPHRYFPIRDAAMAVECADAVAAAALKKPGRPTFFETPAWSFSMRMEVLLVCWEGGNAEFIAAVKQPRYAGTDTNNGTDKSGRGD